ncbi:MAG: PAS domain-containing sensor histidine kinase [Syntrophobacteraceae bacterium]
MWNPKKTVFGSDTDKKKRVKFYWIVALAFAAAYFVFLEVWYSKYESDFPMFGNILFALINLNVILLLLLTYLVLRNIVKLIFERKRNILGHKLRTRLVIAFVGLTLIPTVPLFWLTTQFIFSSMDHWFTQKVEQSLDQSNTLVKDYIVEEGRELTHRCNLVTEALLASPELSANDSGMPPAVPQGLIDQYQLDAILVFNPGGGLLLQARSADMPPIGMRRIRKLISREGQVSPIVQFSFANKREGLLTRTAFKPSSSSSSSSSSSESGEGDVVVIRVLPSPITEKFAVIASGYEDYLQMKLLEKPLKISHFVTFSIVTLLVIFAAIWFGFYLAKGLTVPIQALVSATQSIALGDLNVELDTDRSDEIGMLIVSFNKMVRDLREGREQLASAYEALQRSHVEIESRRQYMEIVLKNIAAGVVSVDSTGTIMTLNHSAEAIFGVQADQARGRLYSTLLQGQQLDIVKSFMRSYRLTRQPHLEQQLHVMIGNRPMFLYIKVSVLQDDKNEFIGVVVVLDDLTDLEKAQRMAAWREVARRIAHEIKNPLTPIQLSAQRLRRKYAELLLDDEGEQSVLNECTDTIIQQVESMKHLVNEFSRFARLPRAQPAPTELRTIIEDSLALYRHNYPRISFLLEEYSPLPPLNLDSDQFKQVMINLFENAIHALDGGEGTVTIRLFYDPILKIARLECADTGHGLSPDDKLRMFEPYYSTKEKGTGLGLAIVASIIADHNGFIRVRDNDPKGSVIIIELPG